MLVSGGDLLDLDGVSVARTSIAHAASAASRYGEPRRGTCPSSRSRYSNRRLLAEELLPFEAHRSGTRQLMRQSTIFETVARRLLERQGIQVIWLLHLKAAALHLDGNWLAAAALLG